MRLVIRDAVPILYCVPAVFLKQNVAV